MESKRIHTDNTKEQFPATNSIQKKGKTQSAVSLQDNRPKSVLQKKTNRTGLPDNLKSGIENLSGHSMDDVKVHYNSDKPAQLNAHAYAQGSDIHLASGQEKHLPHEAWHIIQQKQGRVKPTLQMKGKVNINDDKGLENEADVMGAKALQTKSLTNSLSQTKLQKQNPIVQRTVLSKIQSLKKGGTRTVYYSTYDPSQEFENQFDAWRLDTRLANEHNNFSDEARYPTVFTHYNTDSHNVPPSVGKAGPHTVSHSSLSFRLSHKIKKHSLEKIRDEQVVTVDEFIKLLDTEAPSKLKKSQRERLIKDYKISYKRLQKIIDGGKENYIGEGHELLMRLIQLNPYTVYGKGKSVSKGRIKHKGERKEDDFETSIDNKAKFKSEENYSNFKSKRKKLYEDSSEEEKEEKGNEHKHKDKKTKSVSLTPLDVMVILGRTVRGALYIMKDDDWEAYELYKSNHPENRYPR